MALKFYYWNSYLYFQKRIALTLKMMHLNILSNPCSEARFAHLHVLVMSPNEKQDYLRGEVGLIFHVAYASEKVCPSAEEQLQVSHQKKEAPKPA